MANTVQISIFGLFYLIVLIKCLPFSLQPNSIQSIEENQIQSRQRRSPGLFHYDRSVDSVYLTTPRPKWESIDMTTSRSYRNKHRNRGDNFLDEYDGLNPPVEKLPNNQNYNSIMNFVVKQIQRLPGFIFTAMNMYQEMESPFEDKAFASKVPTKEEMTHSESLEFFRRRPQLFLN